MTEQDKQALIEYYCQRDCGHTREECCLDNCYEIMLIEEFPITPTDTDTISRQAAIDRATKEHDFFRGAVTVSDKARRDELLNVMCWLGELPSAQPEIIRCKGCKYHDLKNCPIEKYFSLDGFCSRAERREVTT